ncbi:phospho-N-acetylmuramoyl-pentapeptide-transferase [Phycisphaerales bacterium AB-hyl4]|uniref:Phospho-N-acetylmuramoyl-pentapeptide-transferase n=1 Tax=Natronomicrosphaera hydrolytica TaxID=3242702 RepID=A0ABV4U5E2_9BACT
MLYLLVDRFRDWIEQTPLLSGLRVFQFVEFRAIMAVIIAFGIVVLLGNRTIRWLLTQKIGDNPEFYHKDLNQIMRQKANTPTMGGILIAGAIFGTTLLLANLASFYVAMAMICLVWLFLMGLVDDWLKLTSARRKPGSREGLYSGEKLLLQIGLAVVLGLFTHHHGGQKFEIDERPMVAAIASDDADAIAYQREQQQRDLREIQAMSRSLNLPFLKSWVQEDDRWVPAPTLIELGVWSFVLLTILVVAGSSNAVNLTDGMDGLASGIMVIVAVAFMILALIAGLGDGSLAKWLLVPYIPLTDELAVVAGAMVGACLGFLWFNCSPAQVFMGDTGSLPLGGLIGFIAIAIRQEFLLLIIGGVFVMVAVSVILQVGYFKISGGKRIFRCAPIHHHFHLGGWTEQQVVVRFWLMTALLAAIALATIKLR